MKYGFSKTLIVVIVAGILIIGGGIGYLVGKNAGSEIGEQQKANQDSQPNNIYVSDDFTIAPPVGWIQTHLPSTLVSYQNSKETQPKGSEAEKINFKSYMAISSYSSNGKTLNEVVDLVKHQVESVAPGISFAPLGEGTIDNQPAKFIEANVSMQNVDFKVMLAVVMKGDKYFTISSNTTVEKWPEYRAIFYSVVDSFKFKY